MSDAGVIGLRSLSSTAFTYNSKRLEQGAEGKGKKQRAESVGHRAIDDFRLTIDYCISPQRTQRGKSIGEIGDRRQETENRGQKTEDRGERVKRIGGRAKGKEQRVKSKEQRAHWILIPRR